MICPTPRVPKRGDLSQLIEPPGRKRRQTGNEYEIAFDMDNVESVRNLAIYFLNVSSTFKVFPDPVFTPFEDGKRVYKGEALILEVCLTFKSNSMNVYIFLTEGLFPVYYFQG